MGMMLRRHRVAQQPKPVQCTPNKPIEKVVAEKSATTKPKKKPQTRKQTPKKKAK